MKAHVAALAILAVTATLSLVAAQDRTAVAPGPAPNGGKVEAPPEREADIRSITELLASFVKTYNARDTKAIGDLFTKDAEIEDEDGDVTRGRDAIVARFSDAFEGNKAGTLTVKTESLRFLGTDLAIEEGTASNSTGTSNRYSVIYAREGGRWMHARIRDEPEMEVSAHDRLKELEWMLGEWVNESDEEVVNTTCKWSADGNFLLRDFDVKIEGRIALRGTQRIGWDSQRGQFRMWVFDDNAGFADGLFSRDGDRWVIRGSGVRSDGQSVSFTTAVSVIDKDRLRWEVLDRSVGGKDVPGTDRFDVVRQPPKPGK